eukprot:scaffold214765_cov31-Tisochrysis_lutea.AAC.2
MLGTRLLQPAEQRGDELSVVDRRAPDGPTNVVHLAAMLAVLRHGRAGARRDFLKIASVNDACDGLQREGVTAGALVHVRHLCGRELDS